MRHRIPVPGTRLVLAAVLVSVLVSVLATGCAKKPEPPVAVLPPSTLDLVSQRGELRVCSTGDYRPFTFHDRATDRWSGSDVELAGDLATRLGVRLTLVPTSWGTLVDDLAAARCDIAMGGVSVTLERARRAAFSQAYLTDGKAPLARCADAARFTTLDAINRPGVRVVVNPGGTNESFVRDRVRQASVSVFPDNTTITQEIVAGRADVMITDVSEARYQARQQPGKLCAVNPDRPFTVSQKAYLLPRGDVVFQQFVDTWIRTAQADGTFARATRPSAG